MYNKKLGPKSTVSLILPNKPQMPKSTPAPGPNGRLSAYSSVSAQYYGMKSATYNSPGKSNLMESDENAEAKLNAPTTSDTKRSKRRRMQPAKRLSMESMPSQASIVSQTSSLNTDLSSIIHDLPFGDREKVTSLVNMAVYSSECFQKECYAIGLELKSLEASFRLKCAELRSVDNECEAYTLKIEEMEEKLNSLEDDAESRQNYYLRNSKAISRLSSTNKTLIDAFALIHEGNSKQKSGGGVTKKSNNLKAVSEGGNATRKSNSVKLSPINTKRKARVKESKTNANAIDPYEGTPVTSNEKLRERLLRVAKEHSRVEKNCEGLENKIMGLRSSLRVAERRNRQLQLELDELKEHLGQETADSKRPLTNQISFDDQNQGETVSTHQNKLASKRVPMTNRLHALVGRNAFDATEGIKQIEALISHLAQTPCTMIEADIAFHLCTRYACRLFDSEAMILFILQPGGRVMHKYATGYEHVMVLDVGEQPSIAEHTLRTGAMRRYNNNVRTNGLFSPNVDSIDSLTAKRVLTFPLRNEEKTLVIGALHLLNKRNNNKFTEVDELYGNAYGDAIGSFFSSSVLFKRLWLESEVLCGVLRASRKLLEFLPPLSSIVSSRPLLPEEVLYSLEHVVRNAMKCSQVKAFLLSPHCGYQEEFFIALETSAISLLTLKPEHLSCQHLPIHSGIAGHVAFTKSPYLVSDPSSDALFNTQIDIPQCETFYCVPVLNISREVVAIVQLVPSALSPNLKASKEMGDSTVAFENAVDWLIYLLSANFSFMVNSIGSPTPRPDIQYLEPITLTEKFATNGVSLEAVRLEEDDNENTSLSKPSSPVENGRKRASTMDEDTILEDPDRHVDVDELKRTESKDFRDDESESRPQSVDIAEKYKRQIHSLEVEIKKLQSSHVAEDTEESKEEENRFRALLKEEYETKYESDLAQRKSEVKRDHEVDMAKRRKVDQDLVALRERVELLAEENEKAEIAMLEEEKIKDEASARAIESILTVKNSSHEDEIIFCRNDRDTECLEGRQMASAGLHEEDSDLDHGRCCQTQLQMDGGNDDKIILYTADERVNDGIHETSSMPPISARSNKSGRSEIPPTPTKQEVESSPRIGDWIEAYDQDGYKYYYNTVTEESSWEKPADFVEAATVHDSCKNDAMGNDVVRIGDWSKVYTEDGHAYWVHDLTGESTWEIPTDEKSLSLLNNMSPQGYSQSSPVMSQLGGVAKMSAGDYSIEL